MCNSMSDKHQNIGDSFFDNLDQLYKVAEERTILFEQNSGLKHPETLKRFSKTVSLLYKAACCYWKCNGGDHIIERLVAKATNQALCAFRLYRYCYYDEALMLIRGIGEIANLLHFFTHFPSKIEEWKSATKNEKYMNFKPSSVRKELERVMSFVPVDSERYSKLCAIGTHPDPHEVPGHFTATGIPIMGMIVQEAGAFVALTELSYSVGLIAVVTPKLLKMDEDIAKEIQNEGVGLIKNLGAFTILNYSDLLKEHYESIEKNRT
jgi:hypothetical protein